jgi:hypothetical protein
MMLQYVQNIVHYPQQKRGLLGAPLNACEDEPRGRCDTKSREHHQVKWNINSVQSYEQQRKEKERSRAQCWSWLVSSYLTSSP